MPVGYAVYQGALSLGGDLISANSASNMNLANRTFSAQQAAINRQFQQQQVAQMEGFQAHQAATAVQTRMADLRAAGINPMMAAGSAAQAMPGGMAPGSMAGTPATSVPGAAFAGLGQSASQLQQNVLAAQKTSADIDNINSQTAANIARNPYAAAQAQETVNNLKASTDNLSRSAMDLSEDYNLKQANEVATKQDTRFQAQLQDLRVKAAELDNQRSQYGMSKLKDESDYFKSPVGQSLFPYTVLPESVAGASSAADYLRRHPDDSENFGRGLMQGLNPFSRPTPPSP